MTILLLVMALVAQTASPIFRFEAEGFWLNLHHYLYVLGRAQAGMADAKRRAVSDAPVDQAAALATLDDSERAAWTEAVTFYANGLSKQDMVFDEPLIAVTNAMRVAPTAPAAALNVDPALRSVLERAAPIYRRAWWPRHREANQARVKPFNAQLEEHGAKVLASLTQWYQLDWPEAGFVINMSGYSNWAGAYSTRGNLIVVSSLDPGMVGSLGLESIFHEAMHQWDDEMQARLARLSKTHQTPRPRQGLTHALIWYTVAEAVKREVPGHRGYAEVGGMWNQKLLGSFKAGLDKHWQPYLDGKSTLDEALHALLKS